MFKNKEQIFLFIITILISSFVTFIISLAWTEPISNPPLGNIAAPLNISKTGQTKLGGLILNTGGAPIGLIVENGKVGIGTRNPLQKFDVVGGYIRSDTGFCIRDNCITSWPSSQPSLSVSCYASPNPANTNQTVTFYSNVSGGTGNYTYSWSGSCTGSSSSCSRSFSSAGTYTANLSVTSGNESRSTSCSVTINQPQPQGCSGGFANGATCTKCTAKDITGYYDCKRYVCQNGGWTNSGSYAGLNYYNDCPF